MTAQRDRPSPYARLNRSLGKEFEEFDRAPAAIQILGQSQSYMVPRRRQARERKIDGTHSNGLGYGREDRLEGLRSKRMRY